MGIKILLRGQKKVRALWRMACTAHNIEKIIGFIARTQSPKVEPATKAGKIRHQETESSYMKLKGKTVF